MKVGDKFDLDGSARIQAGETLPTWYALRTPPQKEKAAREFLRKRGVHAFYPDEERTRIVNGRKRTYTAPIVSGYVFARFTGLPLWHVLRARPFFSGVVSMNGVPFALPRPTIRRLQGFTIEMEERRREMREMREMARKALEPKVGDIARITDGPLAGFLVEVTELTGGVARYLLPGSIKGEAPIRKLERKAE